MFQDLKVHTPINPFWYVINNGLLLQQFTVVKTGPSIRVTLKVGPPDGSNNLKKVPERVTNHN